MISPQPTFHELRWGAIIDRAEKLLQSLPIKGEGLQEKIDVVAKAAFEVRPVCGEIEEVCSDDSAREMARLYLHVLSENDRFPPKTQLSLEELDLLRCTLQGFFGNKDGVDNSINRVFRLVQNKMEIGHISQAWNVLQLFEYDREVRLTNEQNLFLEEMALRFRQEPCRHDKGLLDRLGEKARAAAKDLDKAADFFLWMESTFGIGLYILNREPSNAGLSKVLVDKEALDSPPEILWPHRWRIRSGKGKDLVEALMPSSYALREFGRNLLSCVYFLTLLTEKSGYERLISKVFGWYRDELAGESITLLSDIHRLVAMEERTVKEAINHSLDEYLQVVLAAKGNSIRAEQQEQALRDFLLGLSNVPSECLRGGCYSLTGFIFNQSLGLGLDDTPFNWMLNRFF